TLLFDDIRAIATAEERHRVAREIHDGIAQELVHIGYQLDEVSADGNRAANGPLQQLRHEVSRVINELRLSIFELRSSVDAHAGLGTTLSEHVRTVGASTGLTVHLSLNESSVRLPADTEVELLRIAQEAVNNARKHSQARNLWVTLDVEPPAARLRVEDDGDGISSDVRPDTFGLQIMQERAQRLHAKLDVVPRPGGGTCVEVVMGGRANGHARAAR
ncbi:MAG: sensor histidine kinase, partial [Mycobacteriales bacterium]